MYLDFDVFIFAYFESLFFYILWLTIYYVLLDQISPLVHVIL